MEHEVRMDGRPSSARGETPTISMRLAILFLLASHAHALVVTILRHGETEWNVKELLQGSMDSPLTPNGVQQAILCGRRLRNQKYDACFTSPLLRARRTAELVLEQLDNPHELTEADALKERCFGEWEGMLWDDIEKKFPEQLEQARGDGDYRIPGGGESRHETLARAIGFLEKLATSGYQSVLCVTHSATANALVKEVLGLPQSARRTFAIRNLAINELTYDTAKGEWTLNVLGDTAHLEPDFISAFGEGAAVRPGYPPEVKV